MSDDDEARQAELREAIERGRKYKIAGEVFMSVLDERREEIVRQLESGQTDELSDKLSELKVMKRFKSLCQTQIDLGELAEKELAQYGE